MGWGIRFVYHGGVTKKSVRFAKKSVMRKEKMEVWVKGPYNFRAFREDLGLTQEMAAQILGVSTRTVWKNEKNGCRLSLLVELVEAMGGEFLFPRHPFDIGCVGDRMFRLSRYRGSEEAGYHGNQSKRRSWDSSVSRRFEE
jgi:DNA-binding XRE family transcriptional regulator